MLPKRSPNLSTVLLAVVAVVGMIALLGACSVGTSGSAATTAPATANPSPTKTWITTTEGLVSGGRIRTYLVLRPSPMPSGPLPVLVVLHGVNASAEAEVQRTDFKAVVDDAILVYPQGYDLTWDAGSCCGASVTDGINDVAFITSVVHQVLASYPQASPSRVYLAGYSNGGKMAWAVACGDPGVFAGVASYGAVLAEDCPSMAAVPALVSAGTDDPQTNIDNAAKPIVQAGFTELTLDQMADKLTGDNRCAATPSVQATAELVVTSWSGCSTGDPVEEVLWPGLNHGWPNASTDPDAPSGASVIWAFFQSLGA